MKTSPMKKAVTAAKKTGKLLPCVFCSKTYPASYWAKRVAPICHKCSK